MDPALIVPVKAFSRAKARLSPSLDPAARARLARDMASTVLQAAGTLTPYVVCDDDEVATWAVGQGAEVLWTPGLGLNGAIQDGVRQLAVTGVERVVIAHSDLPLAEDLSWVAATDGVTIVPDRRLDGSNVMSVPTDAGFRFQYGAGSFRSHRAETERLGLLLRIARDDALGWDVDVPGDLLPQHR